MNVNSPIELQEGVAATPMNIDNNDPFQEGVAATPVRDEYVATSPTPMNVNDAFNANQQAFKAQTAAYNSVNAKTPKTARKYARRARKAATAAKRYAMKAMRPIKKIAKTMKSRREKKMRKAADALLKAQRNRENNKARQDAVRRSKQEAENSRRSMREAEERMAAEAAAEAAQAAEESARIAEAELERKIAENRAMLNAVLEDPSLSKRAKMVKLHPNKVLQRIGREHTGKNIVEQHRLYAQELFKKV